MSRNNQLDLHGMKHEDVDRNVENFILLNQDIFPLNIICGNSSKMLQLVNDTIDRLGCDHTSYRYGIITIKGWK